MATATEGFLADAAQWRAAVGRRAPPYRRLLEELEGWLAGDPAGQEVRRRLDEVWAARTFSVFYERPLLLLASLRLDALERGETHPLWPVLAAPTPDVSAISRAPLAEAFAAEAVWSSLRTRYIQTNDTSRAVAWLWPAWIVGCDRGARPLKLVEIGTAAGLVLVADRLESAWTDGRGAVLPIVTAPEIPLRLGIDRRPVNVRNPDAVAWLRACIWAGETERLARFEASVAACRAEPPRLETLDATAAPARLRELSGGGLLLAFQTIVRDYFSPEVRRAYDEGMRAWLAESPPGEALWIELELAPADDPLHLAALTGHVRDGAAVADLTLARTGYHPTDVIADETAVARLRALCR